MITPFTPLRLTRTATIHLNALPGTVFPLFTPLGERLWVPDWNPTIIYPASGALELDAVFTTANDDGSATAWTVVEVAPEAYRVSYVRVAPNAHVARITVQCAEAQSATQASVTYVFTGLTEAGNVYVAQFTESYYEQWIQGWEAAINAYLLRTG